MEVEELTDEVLVWRVRCEKECLYIVMEEGDLIFLKEIEVERK